MKKCFKNDYSVLVHPRILEAITKYASEVNIPYGLDYHSENAEKLIKEIFGANNGDVYFISGGTQTNMVFISSCLKHYEGVISADTGHINVHETAAIEGSGYKIITIKNQFGKLIAKEIEETLAKYIDEHMVKPKMVYISNSTEVGSIYSLEELEAISLVCKKHNLYLFLDGARIGSALTSDQNDVKPTDLGRLCDGFYVGGTKNGLLLGEALIVNNPKLKEDFRYHIKNKGAMLAKGYLIGIEFEEAFKDNFYFEIAKCTNEVAKYLKKRLIETNIKLENDSPTNQIFVRCNQKQASFFVDDFGAELWEERKDYSIIRLVVSFASSKDDVDFLIEEYKKAFIKGLL